MQEGSEGDGGRSEGRLRSRGTLEEDEALGEEEGIEKNLRQDETPEGRGRV